MRLLQYKSNRNLFTTFINLYTTINIAKRFGGNSSKTGKEIATKSSGILVPRNTTQQNIPTPNPMHKTSLKDEKHPTSEEVKVTYQKSVEEARKQAQHEAAQKTRQNREEKKEQQNKLSKELQTQKERKEQVAGYSANQQKQKEEPTSNEYLLQNETSDSQDISTLGPRDLGGNEFNDAKIVYNKVFYEKQIADAMEDIQARVKKHYCDIIESCEISKKRLKNISSLENAQEEILNLYKQPCMKEAFDLLSIKRYNAPLTLEQIKIIENFIEIKNQLQEFAKDYTTKYNLELQLKIEKITDVNLRELCLKLSAEKDMTSLEQLKENQKVYTDMQNYLQNNNISDEILNYIGLSCGILKFQKTSPILQGKYYDKLEKNPELYNAFCLHEKPTVDFILNSKYYFAKLPCPDNTFMQLALTTHYSLISEETYTLSDGKKVHLIPGYITSKKLGTILLSDPNNIIMTPEGKIIAKFLFTFNSFCFITEEEMKSVSCLNGNISLKEPLEISKNIWSNNSLKKPLVMTAHVFKQLLIETLLEEGKTLDKSYNILSNGTERDKASYLKQQKLSQDNENKNKLMKSYSKEIQEAISMVNTFAKDLESTKKKSK